MTTCAHPGCHRKAAGRAAKYCYVHAYQHRTQARQDGWPAITLLPRHPKRITDALHELAETPGLTLREYVARKHEILRGETR